MKFALKAKRGFTLVEILVVVAIIAILAGTAWEAYGMIENKKLVELAKNQVSLMSSAMNNYRTDNGDTCPYGTGDERSSNVLYRALFCDENEDGMPDNEGGVTRTPYCESLAPVSNPKDEEMTDGIPCYKVRLGGGKKGKHYAIFDPWNKPYRYRLGSEMRDSKGRKGGGMNPDFDIFSQGPDGLGDGLTNEGDNKDNISNVVNWF